MELNFVRAFNSITHPITTEEVSDFVVLSGPNGSGKTNLLEAIRNGAIEVDGVAESPGSPSIRLYTLAQLANTSESELKAEAVTGAWVAVNDEVQRLISQAGPDQDRDAMFEQQVVNRVLQDHLISQGALSALLERAGKRLIDLTRSDYRQFAPLVVGNRDAFGITMTEVFLLYQEKLRTNRFNQWLVETKPGYTGSALTDEGFEAQYGPPPWEVVNETIQSIGLEYEVEPPDGDEPHLSYQVRFIHATTGTHVTASQLSSGEKTLITIVMNLYASSQLSEVTRIPRVMLLDEADAALHPSMAQALLRVMYETFHKRFGVKVIMTTHAPSTVALAPDESLYVMRRSEEPRLLAACRDLALASLTVGIPTMSVSLENRRQVFLEAEDDEQCYQDLFSILRPGLETAFSLEFIASGKGGKGDAEQVKHLVKTLRDAGNNSVWGIIDRDTRSGAPSNIVFNPDRYSLENLVLDPLAIAVLLIRERIVDPTEMLLPDRLRHTQIDANLAQAAIDYVTGTITDSVADDTTPVVVQYDGGFSANVTSFYLNMNGHELENRLLTAFPGLRKFPKLKQAVVRNAMYDVPGCIPTDAKNLFGRILIDL